MIANRNFGQYEPLTWVGRMPIYLATALAIAHGVALIAVAILMGSGLKDFVKEFVFWTPSAIGNLHLWQFFTYAFVYEDRGMYLINLVQFYMLFTFGQEVEKFIGRRQFALMYVALVLAEPLFLTLLSLGGVPRYLSGSMASGSFAVFVAFVLIYPHVQILFSVEARWLCLLLLLINVLQLVGTDHWVTLGTFSVSCGVATFWMAKEGVRGMSLPSMPSFKTLAANQHSKKHLKVVRRETDSANEEEDYSLHDSIDPILDKIAKDGIASLTRSEREKLERARVALLEKEGRR
ncbi:hypothetical protein BH09VER1_BH09VER1_14760 [soil metagenome]